MKMTVKQIEKVFYQDPFQPFRVLLENGEEVIVQKPRKASVSGDQVAIVGLTTLSNGRRSQGLRFIPVSRIVSSPSVASFQSLTLPRICRLEHPLVLG